MLAEDGWLGTRFWSQQAYGERSLNFISSENSNPCLGRKGCWRWGLSSGGGEGTVPEQVEGEGGKKPMAGVLSNPLYWAGKGE